MVLQSASITSPLCCDLSQRKNRFISFGTCAATATTVNNAYYNRLSRNRAITAKNMRWPLLGARASTNGETGNPFNSFAGGGRMGAKSITLKRFSDEEEHVYASLNTTSNNYSATNFDQEDPIVDKLRNQLGAIHHIPIPPPPHINRNILGLFALFFFVGVVFDKLWMSRRKRNASSSERSKCSIWPQVPSSLSSFLEKDLQRKESVEWVNMVLGKLWKVYRGGIENWSIGFLQPVIDNLKKPNYVERVEIKHFSLGDEPLSVRSVERRTSRGANDLQYQIGLRYAGGARMLLLLSLKFGIFPVMVSVGVHDFDIDGELWVKLRLIPTEPWVGAVSWAFVSLPKIKFELSPIRLFNIMSIPVISMFLTKLFTEDLPKQFVRPKQIVLDFQKGKAVQPVPNDFKPGENLEGNIEFSGELSVTLLDARKLSYIFYGKTDPYVILRLGDQVIRSKRNSQTTVIGPPGEPIWNQDFHMLVADPRKEKLLVQVKDSLGFTDLTVGTAEVDLGSLKDTVPEDRIVVLKGDWSLFGNGSAGEILLHLTYKAYVEDEEEVEAASRDELSEQDYIIGPDKESFMDVLAALLVSDEFRVILNTTKSLDESGTTSEESNVPTARTQQQRDTGSTLVWLAFVTIISLLIALNMGISLFNP